VRIRGRWIRFGSSRVIVRDRNRVRVRVRGRSRSRGRVTNLVLLKGYLGAEDFLNPLCIIAQVDRNASRLGQIVIVFGKDQGGHGSVLNLLGANMVSVGGIDSS
jgi:hypothetical protein